MSSPIAGIVELLRVSSCVTTRATLAVAICRALDVRGVSSPAFRGGAGIALERGRECRADEPSARHGALAVPAPELVRGLDRAPPPGILRAEHRQLVRGSEMRGRHAEQPDPDPPNLWARELE